ncbi:hypothetical protein O6H91_Y237700 [Diphasiastrum complanatum]|nr:hypothetical protein O6H91_Y237700 [Diphasiastrum complanatum]
MSRNNGALTPSRTSSLEPEVHFYAGDWSDVHEVLSTVSPLAANTENDSRDFNFNLGDGDYSHVSTGNQVSPYNSQSDLTSQDKSPERPGHDSRSRKRSGSRACERSTENSACEGGYDIILMSETVYSLASLPRLYSLIKKCLRPYYGVVYVAGKKHYFGVGGGTRQFKHLVEDDGIYGAHLVSDFADGCSNVREIWKFFLK